MRGSILMEHELTGWLTGDPFVNHPIVIGGSLGELLPGRKKKDIQYGVMANSFSGKEEYVHWLFKQLRNVESEQYKWMEDTSEGLANGERFQFFGDGGIDCHGYLIKCLLEDGRWRRWDTLDPNKWIDETMEILFKNWGDIEAFSIEFIEGITKAGKCATEAQRLQGELRHLDCDNLKRGQIELITALRIALKDHIDPGPDAEEPCFKQGTKEEFVELLDLIIKGGGWPKTEGEKQHEKIKELVESGASGVQLQEYINQSSGRNQWGLERYAAETKKELERKESIEEALENIFLRGETPQIKLADYFPQDWLGGFDVLLNGLKFTEEVIVAAIVSMVAATLSPKTRVVGESLSEKIIPWVFFIGSSGTAKSVLLKQLCLDPIQIILKDLERQNQKDIDKYKQALAIWHKAKSAKGVDPGPQPSQPKRPRNFLYTAPTTQGLRADFAERGEEYPGVLVRDELNGWLVDMNSPMVGKSDVEFYLSAYDGTPSVDVFADPSKSRKVEECKLGVIGGIQPKVFIAQLGKGNANGFNSRPLFFHLPRTRRELLPSTTKTTELKRNLEGLYFDAYKGSGAVTYWLGEEATVIFKALYDQLETLSLEAGSEEVEALWAKASGQILRYAAAIQCIRNSLKMEDSEDDPEPPISSTSLELAANLVMAGKVTGVQLQEQARNPQLALIEQFLAYVKRKQPVSTKKGILISKVRAEAWEAKARPSLQELKELAQRLFAQGKMQLLNKGKEVRVV